jgi:hypothetical protein
MSGIAGMASSGLEQIFPSVTQHAAWAARESVRLVFRHRESILPTGLTRPPEAPPPKLGS